MTYHTILVAFVVEGDTLREAQETLMPLLPRPEASPEPHVPLDCWWIAEDERYDRSDCDSAVFCAPGNQAEARALICNAGLN